MGHGGITVIRHRGSGQAAVHATAYRALFADVQGEHASGSEHNTQ